MSRMFSDITDELGIYNEAVLLIYQNDFLSSSHAGMVPLVESFRSIRIKIFLLLLHCQV